MRRVAAPLLAVLLATFFATGSAPSAEEDKVKMDDKTKKAVDKALDYLKDNQAKDGSWGGTGKTAVTAFALLAFMANGHVPNQGTYGPEVAKGVRFLLSGSSDTGYLVHPSSGGGNMYCHGMAALALSQVWGMTGDEEVKKVLKKAIDLIVKSQNHEGGWRYEPSPSGADISVTIMQVMALRGAKDSGLHVPDETIKKALGYIEKCRDGSSGGYKYQPSAGTPGYARTAAGVCILQLSGEYEAKQIEKAVKYMETTTEDRQHWWYGHYYAAHAFNQVGGKKWEDYYARMKTKLLATQKTTGEWNERQEQHVGPAYQTAIAVLILSVPTHYLPIYQR
jgi:prenyltransferase beta subunit